MKTKCLRRKPRPAFPVDQLDQAFDCCRNIETTALLLETCGIRRAEDELSHDMIANAGSMIYKESIRLRRVLTAFQTAQSAHDDRHLTNGSSAISSRKYEK